MTRATHYIQLTKPTIVILVVVTALAALAAEGFLFASPLQAILIVAAIGLAAGSANAFNQYLDRDIDSVMDRTRVKRPLPLGQISPLGAFVFASLLGALSTAYLWIFWNLLAALVSASTILFYTLVYTLILKRRHYYNIVIGGAAGAAGPIIAWAAVEGQISGYAWLMFALIFMWTPAHFWALALAIKDDYSKVSVPMLPCVLGENRTRWEIIAYTISLLPLTLLPYWAGWVSLWFLLPNLAFWIWYMRATLRACVKEKSKQAYMRLFYISILYLFLFFIAVAIDGAVRFFV
ncbi:MAG: protoheme IX farnesyltransferase [Bradymonadales bacterium]|nr:MAG: protoheme IX farnesyltransferase [Bradymonadales bacterium]